ncbi:histidine phosphatase family protein [Enterococcus faecalis]|nr:histidine phosphatase family protein [Enterococcus faecalis]
MKKTLYLMRHGQTLFNQKKKIQGWCDSPLTKQGIEQAKIAKEFFEKNGIIFDGAHTSTLERASDTLELITEINYERHKGLKEWNFGRLEAEHEYLNPPLPYRDFFVQYGGEEEIEFRKRVTKCLVNIMQKEQGKTILVVSHGAACRQFIREWAHLSDITPQAPIGNCSIMKFCFENDQFYLEEIINHDFSHLE